MPPIGSSNAQRRAMTLRSSSGIGSSASSRHPEFAGVGRVVGGAVGLLVVLGLGPRTTQSTSTPGTWTCRGFSASWRADALDLRDHEAAGVLRGHGEREVVERQRLALHGDVAATGPPWFRESTRP